MIASLGNSGNPMTRFLIHTQGTCVYSNVLEERASAKQCSNKEHINQVMEGMQITPQLKFINYLVSAVVCIRCGRPSTFVSI